jgi:hypothetical protein
MKVIGIVVCGALALAVAVPTGAIARSGHKTQVVCVSQHNAKSVYRVTPRRCTFHERGKPQAEAFYVRTKRDRWDVWHRTHARGKGKNIASMGAKSRVRIRLKDPVKRCGHRVFSKARFNFPGQGSVGTVKLDLCA